MIVWAIIYYLKDAVLFVVCKNFSRTNSNCMKKYMLLCKKFLADIIREVWREISSTYGESGGSVWGSMDGERWNDWRRQVASGGQ